MLACLGSSQAWTPLKEPSGGSFGGPSCSNIVNAVRVGMDPRLRRLKSGDRHREKYFCGKTKCGSTGVCAKPGLWIVLSHAADRPIDCPQKWNTDLDSGLVIKVKTDSFKPSDE